jgi:hypothetical protein
MEQPWSKLLLAAAQGEPFDDLATGLALGVMGSRLVRLAQQVLAAGPDATTAAIELAAAFTTAAGSARMKKAG